jgi:hypothetical protein
LDKDLTKYLRSVEAIETSEKKVDEYLKKLIRSEIVFEIEVKL